MASESRRISRDLIREVSDDAPRFAFCQAIRVLGAGERCALPTRLRFRTPASLAFPPSEVMAVRALKDPTASDDANHALEMEVGFLGLTGPSGALPVHYTELLIERTYLHRDRSAHAFLDLFSHRAISLFYQAWRKYRFPVTYEQGEHDGFTRNLLDLVGVGLGHLRDELQADTELPDRFMAYFAGLLSQKPISASAMVSLMQGFFNVPARIEQFVGHWVALPPEETSRLGGQACQLGVSAVAGSRVWDNQTKMRVVLGPLSREQYARFLPGQPAAAALQKLLKFCVGHNVACDAQLILKKADVPPPQLSRKAAPMRLGYNTWLHSRPPAQDRADAAFTLLQ